jgi:hypothetical protein
MKRRQFLHAAVATAAVAAAGRSIASPLPPVEVFKSATCGCCGAWIEHLQRAGFRVTAHNVPDTTAARKRLGMPDIYGSCHTATVGGYVVEGHVPADEIKRLLAAKPAALGLAVPSMPPGSPGMEVGSRRDPYEVLLVDKGGRASVFARYPKPTPSKESS